MPNWEGSDRRSRLPGNWLSLREEMFELKGRRCLWLEDDGTHCGQPADQADHIVPSGEDTVENLQPLCSRHHRMKSSSEGWQAMNRKKKKTRERVDKKFGWAEERAAPAEPFRHPWQ